MSLESALRQLEAAARATREALGRREVPSEERSERMILSVLADVERRGGRVPKDELLGIGERYGYERQGMAGFYQRLLRLDGSDAVLTEEGRTRLAELRMRVEPLPAHVLSPPPDAADDPFVRRIRSARTGSGCEYDAEDDKRALYGSP